MRAKTHQLFGGTFGLVTIYLMSLFKLLPNNLIQIIIFFGFVMIGSLLPDIDHYKSKLGRKLWVISIPTKLLIGHRTFTHSLLFWLILSGVSIILAWTFHVTWFYPFGLSMGMFSHIIGDMLVVGKPSKGGGVPLFYPFMDEKYKFPIAFKLDGFAEKLIQISCVVANVLMLYSYWQLEIIIF